MPVPGNSAHRIYNSFPALDQSVKKRGFSNIRSSYYSYNTAHIQFLKIGCKITSFFVLPDLLLKFIYIGCRDLTGLEDL